MAKDDLVSVHLLHPLPGYGLRVFAPRATRAACAALRWALGSVPGQDAGAPPAAEKLGVDIELLEND